MDDITSREVMSPIQFLLPMNIRLQTAVQIVFSGLLLSQVAPAHAGILDDLKGAVSNALDTSKADLKRYESVEDKQLVDSFYYISADGKEQSVAKDILAVRKYKLVKLTNDSLTISDFFKKQSMYSLVQDMRSYSFDPLDVFGKRYVALANSRGNQVRQYKPALGGMLNSMLKQHMMFTQPAPNIATWLDVDNVLAEYSPSGALVSVMTRAHQAVDQITATSDQYIHFYFGKDLMRIIENRVSNRTLDDNFQRVVVLDGPADGAQPAVTASSKAEAIGATTAPAPQAAGEQTSGLQQTSSEKKIQLLRDLVELKKSGALTEEEFAKEKAKVLGS